MADQEKQQVEEKSEYDHAWDELTKEKQEGAPAEQKEEEPTKEVPEDQPEEPEQPEEAQEEQDVSKDHGKLESVEKALKDTKGTLTRAQQSLSEKEKVIGDLQARLEELEAKTKPSLDDEEIQDEMSPKVREYLKAQQEEIKALKDMLKPNIDPEVRYFQEQMVPVILKEHPDFNTVTSDENFYSWLERQSDGTKYAAQKSKDPQDVVNVITSYKKHVGSDEAEAIKQKHNAAKKQKQTLMTSIPSGGTKPKAKAPEANPDDYDAGWEEAQRILQEEESQVLF